MQRALRKHYLLYLMMFPIFVYFFLFCYYPLVRGLVISFQKFRMIGNRPFIGFENYRTVLNDMLFWESVINTLLIGGGILIVGFFAPILVALSLNEVLQSWFKKTAQMIIYLPHLFSWVVVGGIWVFLLAPDGGMLNGFLKGVGLIDKPIHFLGEPEYARWIMIASSVWKEVGFTCILYLASIVGINPSLYEAARIDGANRWQLVRFVTVPQLAPTMKIVFILGVLNVLRIFDQIYMMRNPAITRQVDVVMIYSYEKGVLNFDMGVANAAGFLVIGATLLLTLLARIALRYDEK